MNEMNSLCQNTKGDIDTRWLGDRMLQRPATPPVVADGIKITVNTIPAGDGHTVVSLRNAIFMGYPPTTVAFDIDLDVRHLGYEGGEWMADSAQEVWQMHEPLEALREMDEPSLLVGGLGLGVFSHLAAEYAGAIVTTIERDERIIRHVAPHTTRRVHHADIYDTVQHIEDGEYDAAFLDTWQSTGEHCWAREVIPLRRAIGDRIPAEHIWCWNEEEMTGQVRLGAYRAMCVPTSGLPQSCIHQRVLRRRAEQLGVDYTVDLGDRENRTHELLEKSAELYNDPVAHGVVERLLRYPGTAEWEAEFGALWDTAVAEYEAWRAEIQ